MLSFLLLLVLLPLQRVTPLAAPWATSWATLGWPHSGVGTGASLRETQGGWVERGRERGVRWCRWLRHIAPDKWMLSSLRCKGQ